MEVTFDMIRSSPEIRTYITQADASLTALGFTEHSFAHVGKCAHVAAQILTELGYTPREVELAQIAAYMQPSSPLSAITMTLPHFWSMPLPLP